MRIRDGFAVVLLPVSILPMLVACSAASYATDHKPVGRKEVSANAHFDPVVRKIEGWTIHVDPKLLKGEHAEVGGRSLKMLGNHLERIAILMPEVRLKELRKLEIWIEHDHPDLNVEPGPYHPRAIA
jgi:hypothetical protein